jgi:hypothetical protein
MIKIEITRKDSVVNLSQAKTEFKAIQGECSRLIFIANAVSY